MRGDHNDHFQATLGIHTGSRQLRAAEHRLVGQLWPGHGEPESAVVRRARPAAAVCREPGVAPTSCPAAIRGRASCRGRADPESEPRDRARCELQELELGLLEQFNRRHLQDASGRSALAARIKSFETAFGMQMAMPDVLDLSQETDATLALYGLERGSTRFAWQCLVARRLAERGVRFIELIDIGSSNNWDAHGDMKTHEPLAKNVDQADRRAVQGFEAAGDARRDAGGVDDRVWPHAKRRRPEGAQRTMPRPSPHGWPAAASRAESRTARPTTMAARSPRTGACPRFSRDDLHLLGFDHERLTFRHAGRDFRLTDVHGRVVRDLLA